MKHKQTAASIVAARLKAEPMFNCSRISLFRKQIKARTDGLGSHSELVPILFSCFVGI